MKVRTKVKREPKNLAKQLDQLGELDPEELRKRWQILFGADPPPRLGGSLMVQAIAYRLQEKSLGGLKPVTRRLLEKVANDVVAGRKVSTTARKLRLRAGSILVREWHGSKHQVSVQKEGFLYRLDIARCRRSHERSPVVVGQARCSLALSRLARSRVMKPLKKPTLRCAVYTRKWEEGLEQEFNSLHAQREACEAFIRSQQGEG
jgi:Protein of unknown function (DUF2924)